MTLRNEESLLAPETALVSYGTLAPGESNNWKVRPLGGDWMEGTVRGWIFEITWGALVGYPGIALDDDAPPAPVKVLVSAELAKNWDRLDDFEGDGYRRASTIVTLADHSTFTATVYEALTDNDD